MKSMLFWVGLGYAALSYGLLRLMVAVDPFALLKPWYMAVAVFGLPVVALIAGLGLQARRTGFRWLPATVFAVWVIVIGALHAWIIGAAAAGV